MERLTKRQREILKYLDNEFPDGLKWDVLLEKLKSKPKETLTDVKLLEKNEFVTLLGWDDISYYPAYLTITPRGREKLQETLKTRIQNTAYNNPWTVAAIILPVIISVIFGLITWHYYSENLDLQRQNLDLQNRPPTASLTQKFDNDNFGQLEVIPILYFKKNSDRLFTISKFQANFTLNREGAGRGISVGDYPLKYRTEELPYNTDINSAVSLQNPNYSNFFRSRNDLIIDYILEIKDMDSQYIYRGNVTTEINSSSPHPGGKDFQYEPLIFNWAKI